MRSSSSLADKASAENSPRLVAGKIYEALRPRFTDKRNKVLLAQFKPNRKVDIKDKELLSDDEENDADETDAVEADERNPKKGNTREIASVEETVSETPRNEESVAAPKTTVNNKKNSPVFNPVVIEYKKDTEDTEPVRQTADHTPACRRQ